MLGFTIKSPWYQGVRFHAKHCSETEHGLAFMLHDSPIGGSIGSTDHVINIPHIGIRMPWTSKPLL